MVVGVDGSAAARVALVFALQEAAMRRSLLRVVAAVQLPDYGLTAPTTVVRPSPQELVDDVRRVTQTDVDEAVAAHGQGGDGVSIAVEAIVGHPGAVLCSAAEGAELLDAELAASEVTFVVATHAPERLAARATARLALP